MTQGGAPTIWTAGFEVSVDNTVGTVIIAPAVAASNSKRSPSRRRITISGTYRLLAADVLSAQLIPRAGCTRGALRPAARPNVAWEYGGIECPKAQRENVKKMTADPSKTKPIRHAATREQFIDYCVDMLFSRVSSY